VKGKGWREKKKSDRKRKSWIV